jgi:hypothetical protein
LAAVKLMTVEVTNLLVKHKIHKVGMMCFAKPILTENVYVVRKEEFSNTFYMCGIHT